MEESKERKERRCKKCNSLLTYIKFSTNKRICRSCGHIEKLNIKKEKE